MDKLPSDEFILEHLRNSDVKVFKQLFDKYYVILVRFAVQLISKPEIAEEIVQDIFESLWERRKVLEINQAIRPYLYSSVRYRCINYFKNKIHQINLVDDLSSIDQLEITTPHDELVFSDLQETIKASIQTLPEQCRLIFNLSRYSGLSYPQIAEQLGLSPKTIEDQMTIALKKIREFLNKNWYVFFLFFFWGLTLICMTY